jgi:hypothetical protein
MGGACGWKEIEQLRENGNELKSVPVITGRTAFWKLLPSKLGTVLENSDCWFWNFNLFSQQGFGWMPFFFALGLGRWQTSALVAFFLLQQERPRPKTDVQTLPCPLQTWVKTGMPILVDNTKNAS